MRILVLLTEVAAATRSLPTDLKLGDTVPTNAPFLGIDFGTSQSSMAWFNPKTGQAEVIRNAEGEDKTPSVVYYGQGETLVGKPAEDLLEDEHERGRILFSVKRHLAKRVRYSLGDRQIRPVDVVAEILRKLKHDAEEGHFREAVSRTVVTHPAVFDQLEKDLLSEAALAAGFSEVVLLPEPVAAALAYSEAGLNVGNQVLVYDLGGGTFDLALLNRGEGEEPFFLATEPQGMRCGGDDFDQVLYDHCDAIAQQTLKRSIGRKDRRDLNFLRECRRRKENLSVRTRSDFSSYLEGGVQFKHSIERNSFEQLIEPMVRPTVNLTRTTLDEAAREGRKPNSVVLIGGSSQVPLVQRLLREALPIEPIKWQGRDVAVALGAAFHARKLWGPAFKRETPTVQAPVVAPVPLAPLPPPASPPVAMPPQLGTLVVRRDKSEHDDGEDETPRLRILVHTKSEDGPAEWVKQGSLRPGETIRVDLEVGSYRLRVRIKDFDEKDEEEADVQITADSTVAFSTHGWIGSTGGKLYVDLTAKDPEDSDEDDSDLEDDDDDDDDDYDDDDIDDEPRKDYGKSSTALSLPSKPSPSELAEKRRRAEAWVNGSTAAAAGISAVTALIPGAATASLCALEANMCYNIGKIYRNGWTMADATKAAGAIGLAALAGNIAALEAAILTGPFAFAIKPAIAGGIVKAMGQMVIKYFEDRV